MSKDIITDYVEEQEKIERKRLIKTELQDMGIGFVIALLITALIKFAANTIETLL